MNGNPVSEVFKIDCKEFMKSFKDNQFDLCIADPWYGIGMTKNDTTGFAAKRFRVTAGINDEAPDRETFEEIRRISKNQIIWGGNYFLDYLGNCRAPIIWDKGTGANYFADGEMAWTSFKTGCLRIIHHQWCGCFKDSERNDPVIHPCQKPIFVYKWLLEKHAKKGMTIYDPFLGSGSSRIAAWDLGYDFYATEIDPVHFENEENRFYQYRNSQLFAQDELLECQKSLEFRETLGAVKE
jgi:site-specific DNA-methyltransferase (adenine-specific)